MASSPSQSFLNDRPPTMEEYAAPLNPSLPSAPAPAATPDGRFRPDMAGTARSHPAHQRSQSAAAPYVAGVGSWREKSAVSAARPLSSDVRRSLVDNEQGFYSQSPRSRPQSAVQQQPTAHTGMVLMAPNTIDDATAIGATVGGGEGGAGRREALHAVGLVANDEETCAETEQASYDTKATGGEGWRPHGYQRDSVAMMAREIAEEEERERGCCGTCCGCCCGRGGEGAQATCGLCAICWCCFSLLGFR
ncbi:hypothetical protein THASP1DRAFT_29622 [Thamnocephalis sphaerospora]|uniref:Uncharacterized protein n=1 Tax=Thamnocephalis sphaerospora TaxID=78915 RepID=A0A4P9XR72_9FUNG|nr:hypothetical protein THASP1DRAFT_29622 [Thamnocephalis sphaerospora]|eukprot:RKP08574.1 hypothetical protein THASP1DRAFT_29622 [Thamnocephalis sphaerospora]